MKVAIAAREGEIATTLDFARQVLVVECEGGKEVRRARFVIGETTLVNRARRLTRLGVQTLICGAISRPLAAMMLDSGVRVVPLVSGEVEEVLAAFLSDQLANSRFLLAGCTPKDREELMFHEQA